MKKLMSGLLAVLLAFCMSIGFAACEKIGPIPNGNYYLKNADSNLFVFTEMDVCDTYGWVINGDTAERWVSGYCEYKAHIVERDGTMYFEGFKFYLITDLLFFNFEKSGNEDDYIVVYNEAEQSIRVTLVVMV